MARWQCTFRNVQLTDVITECNATDPLGTVGVYMRTLERIFLVLQPRTRSHNATRFIRPRVRWRAVQKEGRWSSCVIWRCSWSISLSQLMAIRGKRIKVKMKWECSNFNNLFQIEQHKWLGNRWRAHWHFEFCDLGQEQEQSLGTTGMEDVPRDGNSN